MEYNTGNYDKYMSRNPLKRLMVSRLNSRILGLVRNAVEEQRKDNTHFPVKILDAGCGEGFISGILFSNLSGVQITGLEYTDEALKIARSMNSGVAFLQGDIMQMPFKDESFDVVLCTEVLEHLSDPSKALAELLRVTKGRVIVTVPHEPWFCLGNMLALKNITRFGNPIDHVNHWSYRAFTSFLKNNSNVSWMLGKSFPWTIAQSDLSYAGIQR